MFKLKPKLHSVCHLQIPYLNQQTTIVLFPIVIKRKSEMTLAAYIHYQYYFQV